MGEVLRGKIVVIDDSAAGPPTSAFAIRELWLRASGTGCCSAYRPNLAAYGHMISSCRV